jgi:hypothetical protein
MLIVRSALVDWLESHAASWARALAIDAPGARRPTIPTPTLSSAPRTSGTKSARRASGAQKSGAATSRPRNPSGITPMIVYGAPPTSTVRPTTLGIAVEAALPSRVAEHQHRVAAGAIIVRQR